MFGLDRLIQLFADQFEQDGDGYLYRKRMRGAAIRITADERLHFIRQFSQQIRVLVWGFAVGMLVAIAVIDAFVGAAYQSFVEYGPVAALLIGYLVVYRFIWSAPWRALKNRKAAGEARSRAEARAQALAKMTWTQLALGAGMVAVALSYLATCYDLTVGWNRLWLVVAAIYFTMVAFRALQKWRLGDAGKTLRKPVILSSQENRPSRLRIAGGVVTGWTTGNVVGSIVSNLALQILKVEGGMPVKFTAFANIPETVGLVLLAAVTIGTTVGQGAAAIAARWSKAAWIVAALNACFFLLLYLGSGRKPMLLGLILLPLITAYFVQRNGFVRRTVASRQALARLVA